MAQKTSFMCPHCHHTFPVGTWNGSTLHCIINNQVNMNGSRFVKLQFGYKQNRIYVCPSCNELVIPVVVGCDTGHKEVEVNG